MSVEIVMPKLSDTMEEGTILKWLKNVGDEVTAGEPIAEVETDKADMELEAAESGVLREIKVAAGESATVGAVIALVDQDGQGASAGTARSSTRMADDNAAGDDDAGAAVRGAGDGGDDGGREALTARPAAPPPRSAPTPARSETRGSDPRPGPRSVPAAGPRPVPPSPAPDVKASPAARKIAAERGIDLRTVRGSGPAGRVVKEDVAADEASATAQPAAARGGADDRTPAASDDGHSARTERAREAATVADGVTERHELSRMRQSIARRMAEAFRDIPHFYVRSTIDMTEAARLKHGLEASGLGSTPITYTHMIIKACALALRRHPRLNASFRDGAIEMKGDVNIGMAVAVEDGLIVPILRHADALSLEDVAVEARRLAEQAQRGRFASEDLSGGTFTVSNMGMLDIEDFAAVINPPQAAILAVGAIKERPAVRDGAVVAARTMPVTLSCDHRIIDGVVGGRFLEELKRLLENPLILVLRERAGA